MQKEDRKREKKEMKLREDTDILIVGLGVIGGGYAKALSKAGFLPRSTTK